MFIFVTDVNGRKESLCVSRQQKVVKIKHMVEELFNVPIHRQRLFFGGLEMENNDTLFEHSVNANNVIQLMIRETINELSSNDNKLTNSVIDNKQESDRISEVKDFELEANEIYCITCMDDPKKSKCKDCGCSVCHYKSDPDKLLLCDECEEFFHLWCLDPPLNEVPDDDWYCSECKNESKVNKTRDKLNASKKKIKNRKNLSWGGGMACVGRSATCTIVPANHFGPIPGIEVGTTWKYRVQVSEAGIHRPSVAGIAGRANEGAFSIVLSGGYEDDVDNGDEFLYTGSGGRDLSGNKRSSAQSYDQELTRFNRALALNCNAKVSEDGAEAINWRKGKPVRVVRNYKLAVHSKYAPEAGNRYDGIYKVVKYYKQKGKSGFFVWRYLFRRDDPIPPPWTKEGKMRIQSLGLKMILPSAESYVEEKRKRKSDDDERNDFIKKYRYTLDENVDKLITADKKNKKLWDACKNHMETENDFVKQIQETFTCVCCQELIHEPVTLECSHNVCLDCLKRSFKAELFTCPYCRHELDEKYNMEVNKNLSIILSTIFPK